MTIEDLPSPTRCPDCGTWLPGEALTCPRCGRDRDLPVSGVAGRSVNSRALIVGAGAAALVAVGILIGWATGPPSSWGPSPRPALASAFAQASRSPSPSPIPTSPPTSTPTSRPSDARTRFNAASLDFSMTLDPGWETFGPEYPNYITTSIFGSQGAEALIYWMRIPRDGVDSNVGKACRYLRTQPAGRLGADLATVLAAAPGTDLISGPSDVRLGGRDAQRVVLRVREDVGCDPGYFFTYPNVYGGALWPKTLPGDTIRVWIVEVEGYRLFLAAETHGNLGAGIVEDIVQTIRFE